jgi:hypothetical protein
VADVDLTAISNELKLQYTELFATEFTNGAVFIWRPLSPYEYKAVRYNEKLSSTNQEHAFCMISVVYSIVEKSIIVKDNMILPKDSADMLRH